MPDFGDILKEFERSKRSITPPQKTTQHDIQMVPNYSLPTAADLREKAMGEESTTPTRAVSQHTKAKKAIDRSLDLHGCVREEAQRRLFRFIEECYHQGHEKVEVVHGKGRHSNDTSSDPYRFKNDVGQAVLTSMIDENRHNGNLARWVSDSARTKGNAGSTWFYLRRPK